MIKAMKPSHLRVDRVLAWALPGCLLLVIWVVGLSVQAWAVGRWRVSSAETSVQQGRLWRCPDVVAAAAGSLPAGTLAIDFHPPFESPYGLRLLPDGQLQRASGSVGYRLWLFPPPPPGLDVPSREQRAYDWREAWLDQPAVAQLRVSSDLVDAPGEWRTETRLPPALADRLSRSVSRQLAWVEAPPDQGPLVLDPTTVVIRQQGYCGLLVDPGDAATAAGLLQVLADVLWQDRAYRAQSQSQSQALAVLAACLDRTLGQQPWLRMASDPAMPGAAEDPGLYGHRLPGRPPYRPPTTQEGPWPVQDPWRPVTRQADLAAGL